MSMYCVSCSREYGDCVCVDEVDTPASSGIAASEAVKRWTVPTRDTPFGTYPDYSRTEVVLASDHEAALSARDAEVAELRKGHEVLNAALTQAEYQLDRLVPAARMALIRLQGIGRHAKGADIMTADVVAELRDALSSAKADASIAALKSQLAAASARLGECEGDLNIARLQRDAKLCSECQRSPALEADAMRYRWLRDGHGGSLPDPGNFWGQSDDEIDAAIDAAAQAGVAEQAEGKT